MRPLRMALLATLALAGLLTMAACSAAPISTQQVLPRAAEAPGSAPAAPPAYSGATADSAGNSASGAIDRMVIRTSFLQLVVTDVNKVIEGIGTLAQQSGGYVVSSESQEQGTERIGKVSVRVPSDRLDETLRSIRGMAIRTGRESATSKDVTEEFVDQEARLRTLKATEEQYLQLMKNARTTEDIIRVQQSLTQTREHIERTEGRMNFLRRNTEMAVINVDLATAGASRPLTKGDFDPSDQASQALRALLNAAAALASVLIWVAVFAPIWLPAGLLIRWWQRRERARYLASRTPATPAPPQ